jgi:hypothetical protein
MPLHDDDRVRLWRKIAGASALSDAELVVRMLNSVVYVSRAALTPEQRIAFAAHVHDAADAIALVPHRPDAYDIDPRTGYPNFDHDWNRR